MLILIMEHFLKSINVYACDSNGMFGKNISEFKVYLDSLN